MVLLHSKTKKEKKERKTTLKYLFFLTQKIGKNPYLGNGISCIAGRSKTQPGSVQWWSPTRAYYSPPRPSQRLTVSTKPFLLAHTIIIFSAFCCLLSVKVSFLHSVIHNPVQNFQMFTNCLLHKPRFLRDRPFVLIFFSSPQDLGAWLMKNHPKEFLVELNDLVTSKSSK